MVKKIAKNVGRILMTATIVVVGSANVRAQIPILDIISAVAKKVVVAIDLKVQELQMQTIQLQVAEKELENTMEDSELGDITGWV
jgi:hypothetical protein